MHGDPFEKFSPRFLLDAMMRQSQSMGPETRSAVGHELAFISLLMGNDCIPKLSRLSYKSLMETFMTWSRVNPNVRFMDPDGILSNLEVLQSFLKTLPQQQHKARTENDQPGEFFKGVWSQYQISRDARVDDYYVSFDHLAPLPTSSLISYLDSTPSLSLESPLVHPQPPPLAELSGMMVRLKLFFETRLR